MRGWEGVILVKVDKLFIELKILVFLGWFIRFIRVLRISLVVLLELGIVSKGMGY